MDERQMQVRGKIGFYGCCGTIIYFLVAAFLTDFDILNIPEVFGFSDFMIASAVLLVVFISLFAIWKDAYFGVDSLHQMKVISMVFLFIAILEDTLFISDCIRGELPGIVTICSLLLSNSLTFSLWYKRREYLHVERGRNNENE